MVDADDETPIDYGECVGRLFEDKFLLAIIDAHPEAGQHTLSPLTAARRREERLRDARNALFGLVQQEGRPQVSDLEALRRMGSEHYNDLSRRWWAREQGHPEPNVRSVRKLAEDAVRHLKLPSNASERLRKKFGSQRKKWLDIALYHDDVPETIEFNSLQSLQKILSRNYIEMNLANIEK